MVVGRIILATDQGCKVALCSRRNPHSISCDVALGHHFLPVGHTSELGLFDFPSIRVVRYTLDHRHDARFTGQCELDSRLTHCISLLHVYPGCQVAG